MKNIFVITLLFLTISLIGCTKSCPSGYELSEGNCIKLPQTVIEEYLTLLSTDSPNDAINNAKNIIANYTTGYFKEFKINGLEWIQGRRELEIAFFEEYEITCFQILGSEHCEKRIKQIKDIVESDAKRKVQIKSITQNNISESEIEITAKVKSVSPDAITHDDFVYYLKKVDNSWLIYDSLDAKDKNSKKSVTLPIPAYKEELKNDLKNISANHQEFLNELMKLKKDLCSYAYKVPDLELEDSLNKCYQKEYNNIASLKKDVKVCDTISSISHLSTCYAYVAIVMEQSTICTKLKDQLPYESRMGLVHPMDFCYNTYALGLAYLGKIDKEGYDEVCKKISNKELRNTCLSF